MVGKLFDYMGGFVQIVVDKFDVLGVEGLYEKKCLMLMKCVIVSCYGFVYFIYVFLLYLFLGENNGVWIWLLRLLIKFGFLGKSSIG